MPVLSKLATPGSVRTAGPTIRRLSTWSGAKSSLDANIVARRKLPERGATATRALDVFRRSSKSSVHQAKPG